MLEQRHPECGLSSTLKIVYRDIKSFHWTNANVGTTVGTQQREHSMTYQEVIDTANKLDLNIMDDQRELYQALVDEQIMDPNMEYADFLLYLSVII